MATDYEKVCPACGTAAPLASKFCGGCGHEYRTVFQDQSEPIQTAAQSAPVDMRWVPLATVIPVLLVLIWAAVRPAPPAQASASTDTTTVSTVTPTQYTVSAPSASLLQYGQTEDDVQRMMGKPQRTESLLNGTVSEENWYYNASGHTLQVHFNPRGQVDSYRSF